MVQHSFCSVNFHQIFAKLRLRTCGLVFLSCVRLLGSLALCSYFYLPYTVKGTHSSSAWYHLVLGVCFRLYRSICFAPAAPSLIGSYTRYLSFLLFFSADIFCTLAICFVSCCLVLLLVGGAVRRDAVRCGEQVEVGEYFRTKRFKTRPLENPLAAEFGIYDQYQLDEFTLDFLPTFKLVRAFLKPFEAVPLRDSAQPFDCCTEKQIHTTKSM